jgi:hypothetical protein
MPFPPIKKTMEGLLEDIIFRLTLVERRLAKTGTSTPAPVDTAWADWAAKSGAVSWQSAYVNVWNRGVGEGSSLDASSVTNGILILKNGTYQVSAHQRGGSSADYIALALNGDRTLLENRMAGVFTHDHSPGGNGFANSFYLGQLQAGEKITAGGPAAGGNVFGATATSGALYVRRVR